MGSKYSQASGLLPSELTSVYKNHQALPICETNESLKELLDNYAYPNPYECSVYSGTAPADGVKYYIPDLGLAEGVLWHIKYFPGNGMGNSVMIAYPASAEYTTMMRVGATDKWDEWVTTKSVIETDGTDITVSNPNLLVNPDFKINQRGQSEYSGTSGVCVDMWFRNTEATVGVVENGITMSFSGTTNPSIYQRVDYLDILGKTVTFSACIDSKVYSCTATLPEQITGGVYLAFARLDGDEAYPSDTTIPHIRIQTTLTNKMCLCVLHNVSNCEWTKLELGSVATPFIPPNPAIELLKIQSMDNDGVPKLVSDSTLPTLMNSAMVSNPNLLINPDFKINQRGLTEYVAGGYTVDHWQIVNSTLTLNDSSVQLKQSVLGTNGDIRQYIEKPSRYVGKTVTISCDCNLVTIGGKLSLSVRIDGTWQALLNVSDTGRSIKVATLTLPDEISSEFLIAIAAGNFSTATEVTVAEIYSVKLEIGSVATPFVPPNPTIELLKCGTPDDTNTYGYMPTGIPSNPNLFDNPDFKINQRGQTLYDIGESTSSAIWTVDRWITGHGDAHQTVTVVDGGLQLSAGIGEVGQVFDDISIFDGKTLTMSIIVNGVTYSKSFVYDGTRSWTRIALFDNGWRIAYSANGRYFRFANLTGNNDDIISAAKLEFGSVATPFIPPNPAEELLKIQSMDNEGVPKLVSDSTLPTLMNSQMVSNPNLFDNPDFKINQRGQEVYNTDAYIYSVDRWALTNGSFNVSEKTLTGSTTANCIIRQFINSPERLSEKTVTVTVALSAAVGNWSVYIWHHTTSGEDVSLGSVSVSDSKTMTSLTIKMPLILDGESVRLNISLALGGEITLDYVKLELGSVATPFVPPDPATELAKCQRFYQRIGTRNFEHFGSGFIGLTGASATIYTALPTPMRRIPTITLIGPVYITTSGYVGVDALTATEWVTPPAATLSNVTFPFRISGTESIAGQGCTVQNRDGTSYIELSADL